LKFQAFDRIGETRRKMLYLRNTLPLFVSHCDTFLPPETVSVSLNDTLSRPALRRCFT